MQHLNMEMEGSVDQFTRGQMLDWGLNRVIHFGSPTSCKLPTDSVTLIPIAQNSTGLPIKYF